MLSERRRLSRTILSRALARVPVRGSSPSLELELIGPGVVHGHKSALAFGLLGTGDGVPVVAMLGRVCAFICCTSSTDMFPVPSL